MLGHVTVLTSHKLVDYYSSHPSSPEKKATSWAACQNNNRCVRYSSRDFVLCMGDNYHAQQRRVRIRIWWDDFFLFFSRVSK
mmetsp:Transcript_14849/g.20694  ORF Transcript_14849/g.20694 Transcript_14849/m.20694 type:complete len:82 (-) Transcript_14849:1263-1508(-)